MCVGTLPMCFSWWFVSECLNAFEDRFLIFVLITTIELQSMLVIQFPSVTFLWCSDMQIIYICIILEIVSQIILSNVVEK